MKKTKGYKPYKGPKDIFGARFFGIMFAVILILGAAGGYLRDGPRLVTAAAAGVTESSPVPDLSPTVYEQLRELSAGEVPAVTPISEAPPPATPEFPAYIPDPDDVEMLAKLIWGEARGISSMTEQAAVAWCVLNRVDSTGYGMGHSVEYVVMFKTSCTATHRAIPSSTISGVI